MPIEKWREKAGMVAKTTSGGAVLPEQVKDLAFSVTGWRNQFVRPPSEYIKSRIKNGLELYGRHQNPPVAVDIAFVSTLANTVQPGDGFKAEYHPISDQDVLFELQSMVNHGEVNKIGSKIFFNPQELKK